MSGNRAGEFFGNLYENFIARDLTFIFGGGILCSSFFYAIDKNPPDVLNKITGNIVSIIIFAISSYFIGVLIHELFIKLKLVRADQNVPIGHSVLELEAKAYAHNMFSTLRCIERGVFIKQIFGVTGSCALASAVTVLIIRILFTRCFSFAYDSYDILITTCLIVSGMASVLLNHMKWKEMNTKYGQLKDYLARNHSNPSSQKLK